MAKFIAVFDRYRTYAGNKPIQFEGKRFQTEDEEFIKVLKSDKNVQEVKEPEKEAKVPKAKA